jgi:hypothetical protein
MLVSTFEIRRHDHERQRYRLFVTNLESKDFEYLIEFHGEKTSSPSFSGFTNLSFTLDDPTVEDSVVFLRNPHVYGPNGSLRRFTIPAQRTALLELYPPGPNRGDSRGFVVLRLPTKAPSAKTGTVSQIPQSDDPVRVLLEAESHVTRVPESFEAGNTGVILARSDGMTHPYALSIALASGKAESLIEPEGVSRIREIDSVSIRDILDQVTGRSYIGAEVIPEENRLAALLELLSQTDTGQSTIEHLNSLLAEAGISIRLC